jgi:ferredoxin-NADP reductase
MLLIVLCLAGAAFFTACALLLQGALYRPVRALPLVVTRRSDATEDLFSITLRRSLAMRWLPLPRFAAGQSVQLAIPGESIKRRYSIARWVSLPFAYELTIKREAQGRFSPLLAEYAHVGARLWVSRPGGHFTLPQHVERSRAVFIAGGVGITPLLAMFDQWAASWKAARRPYQKVHLYWQLRHEQDAVYREALMTLAQKWPQVSVRILVSRPTLGPAEKIGIDLLCAELGDFADTDFYLCAGPGLLDSMLVALKAAGVAEDALHFERFALGAASTPEANWTIAFGNARFPFAGHASLLDALEEQRLPVDADCRTGSCGRCLLVVEQGEADHRITPEYAVPPGHVLACCAFPKSDLRLRTIRTTETQ